MKRKILVTGGAGFIGVNLVAELLRQPDNYVIAYDNLSRSGVENNLRWLQALNRPNFEFVRGDVRDYKKVKQVISGVDLVYHLAAQVAVTSSVAQPLEDFMTNATGTLYLLEACRQASPQVIFVFSSTNKVYGELADLKLIEGKTRYRCSGNFRGIDENRNLDFHSPYGCSKGTADQYVRDYHRIYGLKTVVFRQSCIYGPHQFGNEDQGWVAHFIIRAIRNEEIVIYGDGKQVRDVLEVSDLLKAYHLAVRKIKKCAGEIYNIGGGIENTFSLMELLSFLEKEFKKEIRYEFSNWRPGDQKIFVSDNTKLINELGWKPILSRERGVKKLIAWMKKYLK
ncbi:MAG: GDP-mannose 4,6-dehydratase [Candidatus Omnitrophica bacterium]|nr:GDP-mannose 4,6-dehydratase [Candidatus Omnitrophota bacterium]